MLYEIRNHVFEEQISEIIAAGVFDVILLSVAEDLLLDLLQSVVVT
jgi:hypothetical protein